MANRPRWLPRPFELLAYGGAAVAALALTAIDLPAVAALRHVGAGVLRRLPTLLVAGVLLQLVAQLVARRSVRAWLRAVTTPAALGLLARTWLALVATTFAYSSIKISVPLLNGRLLDAALWRWDQALHLGFSPSVLAVELVAGTPLARWLDAYYMLWLTSVLSVQSAVFWSADFRRRRHFALACVALWLAGAALYATLPAVGPCFTAPEVFAPVRAELPGASALQARLWSSYQDVLAVRDGAARTLRPFLAVAALPSLHVGAHWLFALWARRHARRLFLPAVLATALTFFAALVTGWHYALDGYAGMLLAWGAVRLADLLEPTPKMVSEPNSPLHPEEKVSDPISQGPGLAGEGRQGCTGPADQKPEH